MLAVQDGAFVPATRRGRYAPAQQNSALDPMRRRSSLSYLGVAAGFAVAIPVAGWGMSQPKNAPQEYALAAVLAPDPDDVTVRKATEHAIAASFSTERQIANYLEKLNMPASSVITDTVYG